MATYRKGILGGFSGKVGNVVGSSWKGISYMRSIPNNRNDPKTEAQLAQRSKFALVNSLLRKISPIVNVGFKSMAKHMTAINSAMSYNLKNAVSGDYPNQQIDFASLVVARGDLIPGLNSAAESTTPNQITFSWTDNSGVGSAKANDQALILVYSPATDRAIYIADGGPERQEESYNLDLPAGYAGDSVEAYLAFVSADGKEASDSEYLGSVTVSGAP